MQNAVCETPIPARTPRDALFSPAFYRPYEEAVQTVLWMLCGARSRMQGAQADVYAMTFRLKTPASIRGKLLRRGLPLTREAAATLNDIAGLRVVLRRVGSVYRFAELLAQSQLAEVVATRDYIAAPKPSGYRSLHLVLRVPVRLGAQRLTVPVEVQLRTAAMDIWASAEHDARYKPMRAGAGD